MRSARKRSFQPEISGVQLEGRQLLTAGGIVAGKAAVEVGHPLPGGHDILPIQGPEAVTINSEGHGVSHPRPRTPMGEPLGGGNPEADSNGIHRPWVDAKTGRVEPSPGRVVSHPRPRIPMGEPHREPLGGGNPEAGPGWGNGGGDYWLE